MGVYTVHHKKRMSGGVATKEEPGVPVGSEIWQVSGTAILLPHDGDRVQLKLHPDPHASPFGAVMDKKKSAALHVKSLQKL